REDIDGAGIFRAVHGTDGAAIAGCVPVNAGCRAVLEHYSDGQRAAVRVQRDGEAEEVAHGRAKGLDVGLLRPGGARSREDGDGACTAYAVVALGRAGVVDPGRGAPLADRADGKRVAVGTQGNREAEKIIRLGVRGLDVSLLAP